MIEEYNPVFISVVIMAAGESKRMGLPKLLMPWGNSTVIEQTVDNYIGSAAKEVIIVTGTKSVEIEQLLGDRNVVLVNNPYYKRGMSSSLKAGLEFVSPNSKGIILALGDQPTVDTNTINRLIDAFSRREKGIVIPVSMGRRGNPVIFDVVYKKELISQEGDKGGRDVAARHQSDIFEVNCPECVCTDIDTPEDYDILQRKQSSSNRQFPK
jgi:molybdenum cofactor cytidylyltransferase